MARRPDRRQFRQGDGQALVPAAADGFAGALARPRPDQQNHQQLVDETMAGQMQALLNSGLEDNITDQEAQENIFLPRISDNFELAFRAVKARVDAGNAAPTAAEVIIDMDDMEANAEPELPRARNLPAVRGGALARHDALGMRDMRNRSWCGLREGGGVLMGYALTQVRALGRQIFGRITDVPIEDISMIGTPFNDREFVVATSRWVAENGTELQTEDLDFTANMPGYRARTAHYELGDFHFLLVADPHGQYVYGWTNPPQPLLAPPQGAPRLR